MVGALRVPLTAPVALIPRVPGIELGLGLNHLRDDAGKSRYDEERGEGGGQNTTEEEGKPGANSPRKRW